MLASILAVTLIGHSGSALARFAGSKASDASAWSDFDPPPGVLTLKRGVQGDTNARILFLEDYNFAAQAGAVAGLTTLMEPRNMETGRLDASGSRAFPEA